MAREPSSMVWYAIDQSTDSPIRRQACSKACSSRSVSRWQSTTKLRRETWAGWPSWRGGGPRARGRLAGLPGGRHEPRVIGQRRVAADVKVVLHPALGGQAVVIPADRVED